jgi:hypothetical protein
VTVPINVISAKQYLNKGYQFIVRYVGGGDGSKTFIDLTQEEGQAIADADLGLCVVQHPYCTGSRQSLRMLLFRRASQQHHRAFAVGTGASLLSSAAAWGVFVLPI